MGVPQIVIDTNVVVSGLRSRHGAAFQLLDRVGRGYFDIHISVPLILEYQEQLEHEALGGRVGRSVVERTLDYHCAVAARHPIFFLWRPVLRDPGDDLLLELAVKAGCDQIVTFNIRDFVGSESFGIQAVPPAEFLRSIGELR